MAESDRQKISTWELGQPLTFCLCEPSQFSQQSVVPCVLLRPSTEEGYVHPCLCVRTPLEGSIPSGQSHLTASLSPYCLPLVTLVAGLLLCTWLFSWLKSTLTDGLAFMIQVNLNVSFCADTGVRKSHACYPVPEGGVVTALVSPVS